MNPSLLNALLIFDGKAVSSRGIGRIVGVGDGGTSSVGADGLATSESAAGMSLAFSSSAGFSVIGRGSDDAGTGSDVGSAGGGTSTFSSTGSFAGSATTSGGGVGARAGSVGTTEIGRARAAALRGNGGGAGDPVFLGASGRVGVAGAESVTGAVARVGVAGEAKVGETGLAAGAANGAEAGCEAGDGDAGVDAIISDAALANESCDLVLSNGVAGGETDTASASASELVRSGAAVSSSCSSAWNNVSPACIEDISSAVAWSP